MIPMQFDAASLRCVDALPVRLIESSRDLGWKFALVEHHQVLPCEGIFETAPTSDQTIVVMTRGEQRLQAFRAGAWRTTLYQPGTVGMTAAGATNRLKREVNRDAGPARKVNIYVPPSLLIEAAEHFGHPLASDGLPSLVAQSDETMRQMALALVRGLRIGAPDIYVESVLRWFSVQLFISSREVLIDARTNPYIDRRLRRVADYLEERFAQQLSVDDLATLAGISKFHFARLFHRAFGSSPYRFLVNVRIEAAKKMLKDTDLPIGEVARRCGFQRANHFATEFGRRAGITPKDFRLGASENLRS